MSQYTDRRYITFSVNEINLIDFNQVFQTSQESLRLSTDTSSSFVKYDLPEPISVSSLITKSAEYTYSEFITLLTTPAWSGSAAPIP